MIFGLRRSENNPFHYMFLDTIPHPDLFQLQLHLHAHSSLVVICSNWQRGIGGCLQK